MCQDYNCPAKLDCLRYTRKPEPEQWYALFQIYEKDKKGRCPYFISNKKRGRKKSK